MKNLKIKATVYTDASISSFLNVMGQIISALVSNLTVFNNLPYTEVQLEDALGSMAELTFQAKDGSRAAKNDRDNHRAVCEQILSRCSSAVLERAMLEATYEERVAIVELSKFTLYKPKSPIGVIDAPVPVLSESPALGTINIKWPANPNAHSWIIQHVAGTNVSPAADWKTIATVTRSKFVAAGLPTGYHSFRLVAVSAVGESIPSEGVSEFAK